MGVRQSVRILWGGSLHAIMETGRASFQEGVSLMAIDFPGPPPVGAPHAQVAPELKAVRYFDLLTPAGMAELADAADSKSADPCGHGGSTPPPGTS